MKSPNSDHEPRPALRAARAVDVRDRDGEDLWSDVPWPVASGELRDRSEPASPEVRGLSDPARVRRVI